MSLRELARPAATPIDDVRVLRAFVEQLPKIGILDGQLLTVVVPAGSPYGRVAHSLGRSYRGGFLASSNRTPGTPYVLEPAVAIRSFGIDPTREVLVYLGTIPANETRLLYWVF